MYQRILVPVDGSPTSSKGLSEAVRLAKLTGGQLRLLHMIDQHSLMLEISEYSVPRKDFLISVQKEGQKILDDARDQVVREDVPADVVLAEHYIGRLADLVVEQALAWSADLIVIGTHGRRGVERMWLGSDAEQIVRVAPVPVLLVRSSTAAA